MFFAEEALKKDYHVEKDRTNNLLVSCVEYRLKSTLNGQFQEINKISPIMSN